MRKAVKLTSVLLAVLMMLASLMSFTGCSEVANDIADEIGAEIGNEIDRFIAGEVESYISKGIERYENSYVEALEKTDATIDAPDDKTTSENGSSDIHNDDAVDKTDDNAEADNGYADENVAEVQTEEVAEETKDAIPEDGVYTTKDDVALYIHTYGRLPDNFITKKEARKLGWNGGGLEDYAPGKCIGGDKFGNYEGLLPEEDGREYTECDIDTLGKDSRGAKRIVFSNDGLIYYTDNHYDSFTLVYGEE